MNEIVNKFLLAGNLDLLIVLVVHLLKIKKELKNLKKQEIQATFTKINLIKACFQHDVAYGDFKDLARRTASDKVLRDKAFNIAKNPRYDGYQRGLASMVYKFFDQKSTGSGIVNNNNNNNSNNEIKQNLQLAKELRKPIIRKFKKRKVYSGFKDNIWGADLAEMQLISKFNEGFRFLLLLLIFLVNMLGLFL